MITDGVRLKMRWWGGFDLVRRLLFIMAITLLDFAQPDYSQVQHVSIAIITMSCISIAIETHNDVNVSLGSGPLSA